MHPFFWFIMNMITNCVIFVAGMLIFKQASLIEGFSYQGLFAVCAAFNFIMALWQVALIYNTDRSSF